MTEHRIEPSSVTKPIQLLAAWLVGLLALNASFLGATAIIKEPSWASGFLVICAAVNVPLFLACLFILQTRFRPEMQEDSFYAKYLEGRISLETGQVEIIDKTAEVEMVNSSPTVSFRPSDPHLLIKSDGISSKIRVNDLLPNFPSIVNRLATAGMKVDGTFGSSSEEPEVPPFNLVSMRDLVPVKEAQSVLRLLEGFVDRVAIAADPSPAKKLIYIGSYGYRVRSESFDFVGPLKERLLHPDLEQDEFVRLLESGLPS